MARPPLVSRRELLEKCAAFGVLALPVGLSPDLVSNAWAEADKPRPATTESVIGPFYKRGAPSNTELRQASDPGLPLSITGRIFDVKGNALEKAVVEIWHTDHLGHYDLSGFRFRTSLVTGNDGKYGVDSVMPGHYPARVCQHVHYLVTAPGCKPFTTQLYFATDPVFEGDPDKNFTRDPLIPSRELVRPVTIAGDPKQMSARVNFDLVLEVL